MNKTIADNLIESVDSIVVSYRTDLDQDRKWMQEHPGCPFLHFTGDTGTHIVPLCGIQCYPAKGESVPYLFGHADRDHIRRQVVPMVTAMRHSNRQTAIQYFDGNRLRSVTMDRADEIALNYSTKMFRQFND